MKAGRKSVGHPVDVASGVVYSTYEDISISGKVNLSWERYYSTALLDTPPTPMGLGWTCQYFCTLTQVGSDFHFLTPEGDIEVFEDIDGSIPSGRIVRNLGTSKELIKKDDNYIITTWSAGAAGIERYFFHEGKKGEKWQLTNIYDITEQGIDLIRNADRLMLIRQRRERRSLLIEYTHDELISSIQLVLPDGQRKTYMRYEYDSYRRLTAAYNILGYAERYEYDMAGRMNREIGRDNNIFSFYYDEQGRCVKTLGPNGYDEKTFIYSEEMGITEVVNSKGNTTTFEWLPSGQIINETSPLGAKKQTEYDNIGRIIAQKNPNGDITKYEYDEQGNKSAIINPLGEEIRFVYSDMHLPIKMIDKVNQTWGFEYDTNNQIIKTSDPLGNEWTYSYDENGDLITVQNPLSGVMGFRYNALGDKIAITSWDDGTTFYDYDYEGRLLLSRNPLGHEYKTTYDAIGQMTSFILPDGRQFFFNWDAVGNPIEIRDRQGNSTSYHYSCCRRIQEIIKATGDTIIFRWDSEPDQLLEIYNEKGERYKLEFDPDGRLIKEIGFDGRIHQYEYDIANRLTAFTNGNGHKSTYLCDKLGRFTKAVHHDGTTNSYEYGVWGLIKATDENCTVEFEYDEIGRIMAEKLNSRFVQKKYNAMDKCIELKTDLGDKIDFAYNESGFLKSVGFNGQLLAGFDYNTAGMEIQRTFPGNFYIRNYYDAGGALISQSVLSSNKESSFERTYEYDPFGNLSIINDSRRNKHGLYHDILHRLIGSIREKGAIEAFRYDLTDNISAIAEAMSEERFDWERASKILSELSFKENIFLSGNRLIQQNQTKYEYDNDGFPIRKIETIADGSEKIWFYTWDEKGQLIELIRPDGEKWRYYYDPFGRRYKKSGPDKTTEFLWNRNCVLSVIDNEGPHSTWLFEMEFNRPIGFSSNGKNYYCINDPIGRPTDLLDDKGNIVWSVTFKSWGAIEQIDADKIGCPVRFQGQWFDEESGLHYNRFRYYDPQTGRFLSPDPIKTDGSLNFYWYVRSPLDYVDPFGLDRPPASQTPSFSGGHHTLPGAVFDSEPGLGVTPQSRAAYDQVGWMPASDYDLYHSRVHSELRDQLVDRGLQLNNAPYPSRGALRPLRDLPVDVRIQTLREIYRSDRFLSNVFDGNRQARDQFLRLFEQEARRVRAALRRC